MLVQQIINGLTIGAIYTLIALSFSFVMGILGILNLSIAELFMIGAYLGFTFLLAQYSLPVAIVGAMVGVAILAAVVERIAYRPLRDAPVIMPLLSTLGVSIVLQNVAINIWGSNPLQLPAEMVGNAVTTVGQTSLRISAVQVSIMLTAACLVGAMAYIVQETWLGRAMRSIAENRDVARLLGVSAGQITVAAFVLSGLLAGSAGVLIGLHYAALTPYIGVDVGLKAVAVMVVGGATRIWGVLLAGPLLGILEVLTIAYGGSSYRDIVIYGLMIIILLVRPQGILGKPQSNTAQRV